MEINIKQAYDLVKDVLKAGLTPMLHGSPGLGKSDLVKQLCKDYNLYLIDLRLSQCDPSDLLGFPSINADRTKAGYVPMSTFPIEGDSIPEGYKGWLILLDEFNSASKSVQAAAYKLVLDRQVGDHNLHKDVYMVAAGNKSTDKAITNTIGTAMQSRMVHFNVVSDYKIWLEWAVNAGVDHRIVSFISFKPESLYSFRPDHDDVTFACGRTWEFLSRMIKPWATVEYTKLPLIAGTIGEGMAREFAGYCEIYTSGALPEFSDILARPESAKLPLEPSVSFAITGMLAENITDQNIDKVILYINRIPAEFQVIALKKAIKKTPSIINSVEVKKWIVVNHDLV